MATATQISGFIEGAPSDGMELLYGEAATWAATFENDAGGPLDITHATIEAKVEWYTANVTTSTSRSGGATATITDARLLDPPVVTPLVTRKANPTAGTAEFDFPAALGAGVDNPALAAMPALVGIVWIDITAGSDVDTARFAVIFRRGTPS